MNRPLPNEPELTDAILNRLPLFPLPNAVLFPGATLPLHLFEPRYRALAEHCVHGARLIALGTLLPGAAQHEGATPPIFPILTVGTIAADRRLPDGRWDIALRGLCRVELIDDVPSSEPFRFIRARRVREHERSDDRIAAERLRGSVVQVANMLPALWPQLSPQLTAANTPALLSDVVAATFVEQHEERRRLLDELHVGRRIESLQGLVAGILLDLAMRVRREGDAPAELLN